MKIAIFAVSLLLLTGNALADPQPWMRKDNPGELSVDTDVTEPCEISEQQLRETVEGVLIRSSITPIEFGESPVWLAVASERRLSGNIDVCDQGGFRRCNRSRRGQVRNSGLWLLRSP